MVAWVVVCHSLQARRDPQTVPALRQEPTPSLTQGSRPCHSPSSYSCRVGTVVPSCLTWGLTI